MEVRAIRNKAAGSVEVARGVRKAQEAALEDFPGPVDSRAGGAREAEEIADKVGGCREVEETVVELIVEALEAREIFRQRPQQDTRVSLGPVFNHFGLLGS